MVKSTRAWTNFLNCKLHCRLISHNVKFIFDWAQIKMKIMVDRLETAEKNIWAGSKSTSTKLCPVAARSESVEKCQTLARTEISGKAQISELLSKWGIKYDSSYGSDISNCNQYTCYFEVIILTVKKPMLFMNWDKRKNIISMIIFNLSVWDEVGLISLKRKRFG